MPLLPAPNLLSTASGLQHGQKRASKAAGCAVKDSIPRPIPCESVTLSRTEHQQRRDPLARCGFLCNFECPLHGFGTA